MLTATQALALVSAEKFADLKSAKISKNFSWEEVFKHCTAREIAEAKPEVFSNAVKQSRLMEEVRTFLGNKRITVTSWYRSPARNKAVGGALPIPGKPGSGSKHLYGLATDFVVDSFPGEQGAELVQRKLDKAPFMAKAGMEWTRGDWSHVDSRGYWARFRP